MKSVLISLVFVFIQLLSFAQDEIKVVRSGEVNISLYLNDSLVNVYNKNTTVITDFETNEVIVTIDPNTFQTGVDSTNQFIAKNLFDPIKYIGEMNLSFYTPYKNAIEKFSINGNLKVGNTEKEVLADGVIISNQGNMNAIGRINIHFDIDLSEYELPDALKQFGQSACIEITQVLTK